MKDSTFERIVIGFAIILSLLILAGMTGCSTTKSAEEQAIYDAETRERYALCRMHYKAMRHIWVVDGQWERDERGWPVRSVAMRQEMAYNGCRIEL